MRVNELSKELGKTNKEVLEILQKNQFDVKSHASSISDDQAAIVRRTLGAGHASQRAVTPVTETSKPGTGKAETKRVEEIRKEPVKAEIKEAETKAASDRTEGPAEPPKKRIAAVYRPQNSTQMRNNRPAGQSYGGSRPQQPGRVQGAGNQAQERPVQAQSVPGTPKPAAAQLQTTAPAASQAAAPQSPAAAPAAQSSGYQGNRDGQSSGYQGNRDGQSGGYQGNRDGQRTGGYQGNRDGQRTGGYQGNRDGQRTGGYQGNRDGQRTGGYQGNRDGQGGRGLNIPKPSFETPVVQKQQNNKQNKNAYKSDKYDKKNREDGNHAKQGKGTKAPVLPPQPKREEPKVEVVKTIIIPEVITIKELAAKMKLQPSVIVKKLFLQGKVVTINQEVD